MKPICPHCQSENEIDGNFELDYISDCDGDSIAIVVNCSNCCYEFEMVCKIMEINKFEN